MSLLIYFVPYLYLFVCFVVHCWRRRDLRLVIPGGRFGAMIAGIFGSGITLFTIAVAMIPLRARQTFFSMKPSLAGDRFFWLRLVF